MADADDPGSAADRQPGPADREYLRVRPADTALDPATVVSHFRQLHQLGRARATDSRLR